MKIKCLDCRGKGYIEESEVCPDCKGTGSAQIVLGVGSSKGKDCETCGGDGRLRDRYSCDHCGGTGTLTFCANCGNELDNPESYLCSTCEENPIVIQLAQPLDHKYLDGKRALASTIINVDGRGALVDIGAGFKGTFKPQGKYYNSGDVVPVRLKYPINPKDRGGKPVPVIPLDIENFKVVKKHLPVEDMSIDQLSSEVGNVGRITAQVIDIFVIPNGPTLFTIIDTKGTKIQGSAYGDNNKQAYPSINRNTVVDIVGRFRYYNDQPRIQIYTLDKVKASEAMDFMDELASMNNSTGEPVGNEEFLVESEVYSSLKDNFIQAAKRIRSAVLRGQNILLRYHSPCVDGTVGAYALDFAIRRYLAIRGARRDEFRRALRRLPHRSPIFEIADVSRDLSFALDDSGNYRNLPLYILVDVGSSEDSQSAIEMCNAYGIDVIIIDHHALSDGIIDKAHTVINPNSISDNHMITSGMLATELANFIAAEQDLTKRITHLAAISGFADKMEGKEIERYLEIAEENEYDTQQIDNIKYALEYVTFGLRHVDGGEITRNILGISGPHSRTNQLIESITPTAKSLFTKSLKIMASNAEEEDLANGTRLYSVDLENYTPRYDYPPHSELLFEFHMNKVEESDSKVATLGISQAYIIVRNSAVEFSFSKFLSDLQSQLPEFGITGGGHNTFGSIQFYSGHKDQIIEKIKDILGQ